MRLSERNVSPSSRISCAGSERTSDEAISSPGRYAATRARSVRSGWISKRSTTNHAMLAAASHIRIGNSIAIRIGEVIRLRRMLISTVRLPMLSGATIVWRPSSGLSWSSARSTSSWPSTPRITSA